MGSLFESGSYGAYVLSAYGLSAIGLIALVVLSWRAYRSAMARARTRNLGIS